jgi:hypothetical protein
MADMQDIDILLDQIRNTIKMQSDGSLSPDKTRQAYKKLISQYEKLEKKYISANAGGYIKGLLHHHNVANSANVTAIFIFRKGLPEALAFAGDKILLNALPELINRERSSIDGGATVRLPLGEERGLSFSLALKKLMAEREMIVVAAVTSTPLFNVRDFEFLAELLKSIYIKNHEFFSPVMMNYMNDLSSEISRIFNGGRNGSLYADHFILFNPPGTFAQAGIYNLIDFSNFIVKTLRATYPAQVHVFVLSLSNYIVLYDEKTKLGLDIRRNRIDFMYHGNNIPYKVQQNEIETQQALYVFLESL